jgi:hypothetical protein
MNSAIELIYVVLVSIAVTALYFLSIKLIDLIALDRYVLLLTKYIKCNNTYYLINISNYYSNNSIYSCIKIYTNLTKIELNITYYNAPLLKTRRFVGVYPIVSIV